MMNANQISSLVGKPIDQQRTKTWRWPSATITVPREDLVEFAPVKSDPEIGDLVLAETVSVGKPTFVENRDGCNMNIFPGTIILGVISSRYALDEVEAQVPAEIFQDQTVSLLNRGGAIGEVLSSNSDYTESTQVRILCSIRDRQGRIANTRNFGRKGKDTPPPLTGRDPKLVLVVGSSMNAGKSNAAKACVYSLAALGKHVVGGKVTGTAARRDIMLMRSAGADEVTDFTEYGYPATYLLPADEMLSLFWRQYNYLAEKAGPDGYIVIEIADGILQRETEMLLSQPAVRERLTHLIFACGDPLSAHAGVQVLNQRHGLHPRALAGRVASSELGRREVAQLLGDMPIFNSMTINVPKVGALLAAESAQQSMSAVAYM